MVLLSLFLPNIHYGLVVGNIECQIPCNEPEEPPYRHRGQVALAVWGLETPGLELALPHCN